VTPLEVTGEYVNDPETMLYSSEVKNILIIGEDTRDASTRGLSDTMILLSVNKKKKRFQMTSFMRDIYTEIDGCGSDKLNAAYAYGGSELLKDTIEDNFKIRIDGCVTVNFQAVAHLVDAVGGVQITLSAAEANAVNEILYNEVNEIMGDDQYDSFLPVADGTFLLNGKQALSYSRIRYVGDADFERTQRQRTVITQMMKRIKKIRPSQFNKNMTEALKYIGSDMSVTDMYLLSLRLPTLVTYKTEQLRVPADDTWYFDETWDGMSIITVDFYANTEYLRNKIYLPEKDTGHSEDTEEDE
jgi:LCP family protein required for cell wall assembly